MKPLIQSLSIENFRGLRQLQIDGLGHVNLITGKNNTGKSTVLEALRLLASNGSVQTLGALLTGREELLSMPEMAGSGGNVSFDIMGLFKGRPSFGTNTRPIRIASSGREELRLDLTTDWVREERQADGGFERLHFEQGHQHPNPLGGRENGTVSGPIIEALVVEGRGPSRVLPLAYLHNHFSGKLATRELTDSLHVPFVSVSPATLGGTQRFATLWDKIALSPEEKEVLEALRIVEPSIEAVSMVGSGSAWPNRIAKVRLAGETVPVPLRSLGDGLHRIFTIILSLVNAKDGLLLIDEYENGLHHSVQEEVWRRVFQISRRLNVQVFATSHSWDSVEAFQKAASESPSDGVLVRLSQFQDQIIADLFSEEELQTITRNYIEVR